MAITAIAWALKVKTGSPTAKLVLIKLADNADDGGRCFPSHRHIQDQCELSRSAIQRNIEKLEKMGLVSIERRMRDGVNLPNIYHLNMSGRVAAQEGDPAAQEGDGVAAQEGTEPSLSLTVNEPLDAQAHPPSKSTVRNVLARVLDNDHVTAVIEHRRQIKKPLTPYGAKRLAAQLEKCRDGPDAAADFMIDKGWTGFKIEWMENANRQPNSTGSTGDHAASRYMGFLRRGEVSPEDGDGSGGKPVSDSLHIA